MTTKKKPITKKILIGELVKNYPELVDTIMNHGLHCVGCHVSTWETLEQGASGHGVDIDKLVEDLNKQLGVN
ncbi:MAG: DUF1858 domain-containing protein [Candidatus Woesearchaeota archaeon]|jgi:hybrid cluster-associated redox disulfide protein|nr:DUF1858 domain-containing protein [Candidatus Woesearchaeota archaeon]